MLAVFGWFPVAVAGYAGAPLVARVPARRDRGAAVRATVRRLRVGAPRRTLGFGVARTGLCGATRTSQPSGRSEAPRRHDRLRLRASALLRQAADATAARPHVRDGPRQRVRVAPSRGGARRATSARVLAPLGVAAGVLGASRSTAAVRDRAAPPSDDAPAVTVRRSRRTSATTARWPPTWHLRCGARGPRRALRAHRGGAARRPQLIVWPETVYPTTFGAPKSQDGAALDREIARFVVRTGRPLVFGSYDADGDASTTRRPARARRGRTHQLRRVPEGAPLPPDRARSAAARQRRRAGAGCRGSARGVRVRARRRHARLRRRCGGVRIAPLICYDAVDPALRGRPCATARSSS